jgi:hypothetical protein
MNPDLAALEAAFNAANEAATRADADLEAAEDDLKRAREAGEDADIALAKARCAWEGAKIAMAIRGAEGAIARLRALRATSLPSGHPADTWLIALGAIHGGPGRYGSTPAGYHALLVLDAMAELAAVGVP